MFYLMTHSTRFIFSYMVKDHSDSERGNPLLPHGLLFLISSIISQRGQYIPQPLLPRLWLKREIAQWVHHEGSIWWPIAPVANALTTELLLAPIFEEKIIELWWCTINWKSNKSNFDYWGVTYCESHDGILNSHWEHMFIKRRRIFTML